MTAGLGSVPRGVSFLGPVTLKIDASLRYSLSPLAKVSAKQRQLQGPLDGSLYATILKSRKSSNPSVVLSPPGEFREYSSALSPYSKSRLSGSTQSLQIFPSSSRLSEERQYRQYLSPTLVYTGQRDRDFSPSSAASTTGTSTTADSVQFQRAFSTPPQERYSTINHKAAPINHHHQQQPRQQLQQHSHQQRTTPQQFVHEIRIVEECQRPETGAGGRSGGGAGGKSVIAKLGGNARDSLTLSMDSGISSSGLQQQVHNRK